MKKGVAGLIAACALLCALPGCTGGPGATPSVTPAAETPSSPAVAPSPTPEPAATPVPTTPPDTESAAATPSPTDDGRVTLAEGFYYLELSDEIKARITGISYPADDSDAKITYNDLRYIRVRYYDFEGNVHDDGELIVNEQVAQEVMEIFYALYQAKYPFTSIWLVDDFGQPADDTLSMEANNTSAFCYRTTSSGRLSWHSFGCAIDVSPVYNPYIDGDRIVPENSAAYVDRSLGLPGMIDHDDLCYRLFIENGWKWGGDWRGDKDWQHFYKELDYQR